VALSLVALSPLGGRLATALPACRLKSWFGIPCPSCGITRSALALAKLDFESALAVNPLATLGWSVFVIGGFAAGLAALSNRRVPEPPSRIPIPWRWALALVVVANWVYLWRHGS